MEELMEMQRQMIEQLQAFVKRQDAVIDNHKEQNENLKAQLRLCEAQVKRLR